ncbi:MAG: catalase-related domain-containing protein [Methylococcaceae bacterium]
MAVNSHNQQGAGYSAPETSTVNCQPSRSSEGFVDDKQYEYCQTELEGSTQQIPFEKTQNFKQTGELYRSFSEVDQTYLVNAFGADLKTVTTTETRTIISSFLYKADSEYGERVATIANVNISDIKRLTTTYED